MDTTEQIPIASVMLVSSVDDHLKRDRHTLSQFKPKNIATFSFGGKAAEYLSRERAQLIVCDSELGDMDGYKFMRVVRQMPDHRKTPIIMVTVDNTRQAVLDAIGAGCTGYILRPYAPETFKRHLVMANQLHRFGEIEEEQLKAAQDMVDQGDFDDAIEEFEEILSMQDEAQKYYDMGCDYLYKQKFGKAIISFNKALKLNDLFAEAYQGLAAAYKGKGNMDQYQSFLQKAAEVHAQFDRMDQAKNIFIEIIKQDKRAPNPFNTLGVRLRRTGDYPGAVHAYKRALELTPEDENILYNLAKAYFFMGESKKATTRISEALRVNSDFPEAAKFYTELTGARWTGPKSTKRVEEGAARPLKDV